MRWRSNGTKYGAQKITLDGYTFDSKKEADRYWDLKLMQRAGMISNLQVHVPFVLIPAQYEETAEVYKKGIHKGEYKKILRERECAYEADFVYVQEGERVVEDCKGFKNGAAYSIFVIKRKLMLYRYGIKILET